MRSIFTMGMGLTAGNLISTGILDNNKTMWISGLVIIACFGGYMVCVYRKHMKDLKSLRK